MLQKHQNNFNDVVLVFLLLTLNIFHASNSVSRLINICTGSLGKSESLIHYLLNLLNMIILESVSFDAD